MTLTPTPHRARRTVTVAAVVATALLSLSGLAFASWASSDPGATAATTAVRTSTVAGSAVTTGLLYPATTGDAVITVDNPNPYPVTVTSVATAGAVTARGGTGTCSTTGVTLATSTPGTVVAANASATAVLTGVVAMDTTSEGGCQNATFTIPVAVTVESGN